MQKGWIIIQVLFFVLPLWGQAPDRDSLLQVWDDTSMADTIRMEAMYQLIDKHYNSIKPDSARLYSELLFDIAQKKGYTSYQAKAQLFLGNAMMNIGNYEAAERHAKKALELFEAANDRRGMSGVYNILGIVNKRIGNFDLAIEQLNQAMDLSYQIGDSAQTTSNMINIATIYEAQGEILKSLEYNQQALLATKKHNKRIHQAITHNNIANNYKFLGDIPRATEHYLSSKAIYEKEGVSWRGISSLNNLAVLLINNQEYSKAGEYLEEAMQIALEEKVFQDQAITYANKGFLKMEKGQFEEAAADFRTALQVVEDNNLLALRPYLQLEMGRTLKEMKDYAGAEKYLREGLKNSKVSGRVEDVLIAYTHISELLIEQRKWNEVRQFTLEGFTYAQEVEANPYIADLALQLVAIFKHFGETSEALRFHEIHSALRDSIYNEESTRALLKQEYQYNYTRQSYQDSLSNAAALEVQATDIKRRKQINRLLWGILLLVVLFIGVLFNRYRLIQRQKVQTEALNAKLLEADELKSRFFTNISHEFRTPLTVISGMIDQIKHQEYQRVKELVNRNTHHLLHLINQILDLRKLESGSLPVNYVQDNVVKYLKYILESFYSLAETKEVALVFESTEQELLLDFDSEKLLRITTNLLSNAIKFTPAGGEVKLRVVAPSHTEVSTYQFSVTDTGVGIAQEKLPFIFDRFYQVDDVSSQTGAGTGIGLTLVKELVELLDGKIEVESKEGQGTSFTVTLPYKRKAVASELPEISSEATLIPASQPVVKPALSNLGSIGLPRLLIVEDNPDVMEYLITCLDEDYQLLLAYDGQKGLEKALAETPDLIISDVMMPRMDGFTMCNQLKTDQRTSHIPIILLTAKADADSRITGLERGANAYLAKPFDQRELKAQLKNLFALQQSQQARYSNLENLEPSQDIEVKQEDAFVLKIKELILANLDDPNFDLNAVSKALFLSRSQLGRKVKALTGKSAGVFIRSLRLKEARKRLLTTALTVSEIAYEVGFTSHAYFTQSYTAEFNESPSDTRSLK